MVLATYPRPGPEVGKAAILVDQNTVVAMVDPFCMARELTFIFTVDVYREYMVDAYNVLIYIESVVSARAVPYSALSYSV
jgi:hypothetical protein